MTAKVYQFPKVSELAEAYANLLAANAMFMKITDIPEYVEDHRLNAGVDMSPHIWLRYVLIKVTRIDAGRPIFEKSRAARKAAVKYIRLRRDRDESTAEG